MRAKKSEKTGAVEIDRLFAIFFALARHQDQFKVPVIEITEAGKSIKYTLYEGDRQTEVFSLVDADVSFPPGITKESIRDLRR